jgi:toxin FitB
MAEGGRLHLVDSDIVIDHIRGAQKLPAMPLACSAITRCELFAGQDNPTYLRNLLGPLQQLNVDSPIAELAGELKRTTGLQTPDALIAATALEHGIPIMTRNRRHFGRVAGLRLVDP